MKTKNNEEGFIAHAGRDFLLRQGYIIKSFSPPGSHGGISLRNGYRGKGAITPDIIAQKGDVVFLVEAKSTFDPGDVEKLNNITEDHIKDLKQKLNLSDEWFKMWPAYLHKAICIGTNEKEMGALSIPDDLFVLAYINDEMVVYKGKKRVDQI